MSLNKTCSDSTFDYSTESHAHALNRKISNRPPLVEQYFPPAPNEAQLEVACTVKTDAEEWEEMSAEQDETLLKESCELPAEDVKEAKEEEDAESLTVPRDNRVRGTDHYADAFEPPSQEAGRAMAGEGKSVLSEDLARGLTDEQKKAIGERWLGNFERLREYGIQNGHFDIPQMDKEDGNEKFFKGLGGWINKVGSGEEVCSLKTHQLTSLIATQREKETRQGWLWIND